MKIFVVTIPQFLYASYDVDCALTRAELEVGDIVLVDDSQSYPSSMGLISWFCIGKGSVGFLSAVTSCSPLGIKEI